MITAVLKRIRTGDEGTFGTLLLARDGRELTLCTGELPWRENRNSVSCIPAGAYVARFTWSRRFGKTLYEVPDVPGRSGIRIHSGNYCGDKAKGLHSDVEGCILVGTAHGALEKQRAILNSRTGLAQLHQFCNGEDWALTILDR